MDLPRLCVVDDDKYARDAVACALEPIDIDQLETRLVVARRMLASQRALRRSGSAPA